MRRIPDTQRDLFTVAPSGGDQLVAFFESMHASDGRGVS